MQARLYSTQHACVVQGDTSPLHNLQLSCGQSAARMQKLESGKVMNESFVLWIRKSEVSDGSTPPQVALQLTDDGNEGVDSSLEPQVRQHAGSASGRAHAYIPITELDHDWEQNMSVQLCSRHSGCKAVVELQLKLDSLSSNESGVLHSVFAHMLMQHAWPSPVAIWSKFT